MPSPLRRPAPPRGGSTVLDGLTELRAPRTATNDAPLVASRLTAIARLVTNAMRNAQFRDCLVEEAPGSSSDVGQINIYEEDFEDEAGPAHVAQVQVQHEKIVLRPYTKKHAEALFTVEPELAQFGLKVIGHQKSATAKYMFDNLPFLCAEGSGQEYHCSAPSVFYAERVHDFLYRSAQPNLAQLEQLKGYGVRTVICLREEPVSERMAQRLGLTFVHIPVDDFTAPSLRQLQQVIQAITEHRPNGKAVVSCLGGIGRTGTAIAGVEMVRGIRDPLDVLKEACESVETMTQVGVLIDLAKDLQERPERYAAWRQALQ